MGMYGRSREIVMEWEREVTNKSWSYREDVEWECLTKGSVLGK